MKRLVASFLAVLLAVAVVRSQIAVEVQIDVAAQRHAIDARIYGVAFADAASLADLRAPLNRWGGNATSSYNWQANAENRASDFFFESIGASSATPGDDADAFVSQAKASGAEPLMTIPMVGWVAKLGPSRSKLASFSIAKYGAQSGADFQFFPDAGNGISSTTGQPITGNDPNDANVAGNATFQQGWLQHLVTRWGTAANGGVRYYALDNEPSIWHFTHRDVHPTGATMDEILNDALAYGAQIKAVDPGALVMGPEEWGWSGYFYSGFDQQWGGAHGWNNLPDRAAHGNADYLPWFLDQLRQRNATTGQRLLDIFSVHFYPQGGQYGNDTSTAMQQLRNRSTRALWDPAYVDESWIGTPVQLVPRLKNWVAASYPGTKVGITEYNWGAEGHINGATTQADILGIFGREGLDVATLWTTPAAASPTYKAIKLYRNYDNLGSGFGDVSVSAAAPNPDALAVFTAQRSADGTVTVMAVNKDLASSPAVNFRLANFTAGGPVQVWQLTASNAIIRLPDAAVTASTLAVTLPAQSITLFVIASSSPSATVVATAGTPQSARVNTIFATALQATVRDASSKPVSGVTVTFTAPASGATAKFSGAATATAVTNISGVATAPALAATSQSGSYTVTATVAGVPTSATFNLTNTLGVPASVSATAGTPQSTTVNTVFATALKATVRDASSNPVKGIRVTFTAPASGATARFNGAATATAVTNSSGVATAPPLTAAGQPGGYSVDASVAGVAARATFSLTNRAAAAASVSATAGTPQSTTVNTIFATALQATVRDAGSNAVSGVTVTFAAPASGASARFNGATTATAITNTAGVATAPALTATGQPGGYGVSASAAGIATPATFSLTNNPGGAASVSATAGTPQSTSMNTVFATALQATVRDAASNAVSGVTVTFAAPGSGASAQFSGAATAVTNASGVATAPTLTANNLAGSYSATATVAGLTTPATYSLTNTAGSGGTGGVTVTGVAVNNSAVKVYYNPVPGAKDYRVYDLTNPNSVKYAGFVHLMPSVNCPGTYCSNHFAAQADGVTPLFPYQVASGGTGGPQVLDVAATDIDWNSVGDGGPHTLVVEAVDQLGPAPQGALYSGLNTVPLVSPTPAGAMLGSNKGPTSDGKTSTNGQGPFTNTPRVIATSQPFVVQANRTLNAVPSKSTATQTFFDTFDNTENTSIRQVSRDDGVTDAFGNLGVMKYSMNAGTPKAWEIEYRQADNGNSMPFISADHFMDMLFDGATPGGSAPTHTIYGSMSMTPVQTVDMSSGKLLHLTMEVDGHQSFRRWVDFNLAPASAPLQRWDFLGNAINTTDQGIFLEIKDGGCTLDIFTGQTSATDPAPTGTAGGTHGARLWGQAGSTGGAPIMCGAEQMYNPGSFSKDAFGLDDKSRYDFFLSATHAALFQDGQLIVQSDIPAGSFPWANVPLKAYYSHYVYHSNADIIDLENFQLNGQAMCYPLNSYWFNDPVNGTTPGQTICNTTYPAGYGFPHSDERHWDNMGFEVLPLSDVPVNNDFSTLASLVQPPQPQPPQGGGSIGSVSATAGTPQSTLVNTAFATALQAIVRDARANPLSGVTVTFTTPATGATARFNGAATATAVSNASGVVTAPTLTASGQSGGYSVTASAAGATPATFSLTNGAASAASVSATAGTPQSTLVNTAFATALQAIVRDARANPLSGVTVTFTTPATGATARFNGAATATAVSNASGVVTAPTLTASGQSGGYSVTASAAGATPANFILTNTSGSGGNVGVWMNVTPSGINMSASVNGNDAYGTVGMCGDPAHPGVAYVATYYQGIWKTQDYGVTWAKVNTGVGGAALDTGIPWAIAIPADGSYVLANNGYGAIGGVYKSTDGGVSWTRTLSSDINELAIDPTDSSHVLAMPHGPDGTALWYESTDGASSWRSIGASPAGIWNAGSFLDAVTFISLGPNGLWRGVKAGGNWTWTSVLSLTGPHGGVQMYRDTVHGYFYVGGQDSSSRGRIYRSPLADGGVNWTLVSDLLGISYGPATIWGTPTTLYAQGNYATHAPYGPISESASVTAGDMWQITAIPAAMTDGAHQAATLFDGAHYIILTANDNAGIWRYIEPTNNQGGAASVSATAGTPQSTSVNTAFATALQATVRDAGANPMSGVTVTFAAPTAGASARFSGAATATAVTNASGVATAPALTATGQAGGYGVTASAAGVASSATFSLTNSGAPVASVTATGGTPQSTTVNSAFATPLQVTVRSAGSSPVPGVTVTFTAPVAGASVRFGGAATVTSVTNGAGVASAPPATATGQPGTYTVSATVAGIATPANFTLTNTSGSGGGGAWTNVTPPGITLDPNGTAAGAGNNFGVLGVYADPAHPGTVYAPVTYQGLWMSTDYGLTWSKVTATGSAPIDNGRAGFDIAPDGSYMIASALYPINGYSNGAWKSTDGGRTWIRHTVGASNGDDLGGFMINKNDKTRVLAIPHSPPFNLFESRDSGDTWVQEGPIGTTADSDQLWIDNDTLLAVGEGDNGPGPGTWRGVRSGAAWPGTWTWTHVSTQQHWHGITQMHIDPATGAIFTGGGFGVQKSTDRGLTWTTVSSNYSGGIVGTPTTLYSTSNYASHTGFGPDLMHASLASGGTAWVSDVNPPAMNNGWGAAAVVFDGAHYIVIAGCWNAGIWRFVE